MGNNLPWQSVGRVSSAVSPETVKPRSIRAQSDSLPAWAASLPSAYGDIQKIHFAAQPDKRPLVVLIQDAHEVYSAQVNIARILGHMQENVSGKTAPLLVGVEGAIGGFNLAPYRHFREWGLKHHAAVADYLLKNGHINGSEFFGLTAEREPLLWGIETPTLYMDNVEAYRRSLPAKPEMRKALEALSRAMAPVKEKIFTSELKALDERLESYNAGKADLISYVGFLAEQDPGSVARLPQVERLQQALSMEKSLDFRQVERERTELIQTLAHQLSQKDLQELVSYSLAYRQGAIGYNDFYAFLKELSDANGVRLSKYASFDAYVKYILLSEKIEPTALFAEVHSLKDSVAARLAETPAQKELILAGEDLRLLARLANHEFGPAEWTLYTARKEELLRLPQRIEGASKNIDLAPLLSIFESFYTAASRRNDALVENLLEKTGENRIFAMVTGGFHTPTLQAIFQKKDISLRHRHAQNRRSVRRVQVFGRVRHGTDAARQNVAGGKTFREPGFGASKRFRSVRSVPFRAGAAGDC
jgi:hypothetical protein